MPGLPALVACGWGGRGRRGRARADLLRSHPAGAGPLLAPDLARAMLVVRLNQIGAGGSGVDPAVPDVLADAINRGFVPPVPLDAARAALFQTAALGAARLGTLVEPAFTGLEAFAADTPASSMGTRT